MIVATKALEKSWIQQDPIYSCQRRSNEHAALTEFEIELPIDQWVEFQIRFRVIEEGIHVISAYAFNTYDPETRSGFGVGKTLYIRSSVNEAIVSETKLSE